MTESTTKEDFASQMSDLKGNLSDLAQTTAKLGAETMATAKDKAAETAQTIKEHAQARATQAQDYTRENPGKALGIAAAVGAFGALILRRKR